MLSQVWPQRRSSLHTVNLDLMTAITPSDTNNTAATRLFLLMIVLCMAAEIGGIIALTVFNKSV